MVYNIKLTQEFLEEVEEICNYIAIKLQSPNASINLRKKLIYNIMLLKTFPKMFGKIKKVINTTREYRKIPINNYIVLYTIDKEIIYVSHIYYKGKNYLEGLI